LAAKLVGARSVLHIQDLEFDAAFAVGHLRSPVLQKMAARVERFILRRFDSIITISRQMRLRILDKGVIADRVTVVRNWVDLDKIKPLDGSSTYRRELDFSQSDFVVLYAGNIGPKQALPVLLEAAERLKDVSSIKFVLAGDGPEKDQLIARFGGLPNVRFLPVQPEDRLCDLLNLPDVHVLPAQKGTADLVLPSKLGGMLASGKQSIVLAETDSELHDFLSGSALLLPPGDSAMLANAILDLHQSPHVDTNSQRSLRIGELSSATNLRSFRSALLALDEARP
jgi:colanic acid biosynthesis glycosyl transferase WcaI